MFIIIWGTKTFKKEVAHTGPYTCNHCNNATYFVVVRQRRWFTLFYIPIFPFSTKYFHICPVCSSGVPMTKEQAKQAIAAAQQQQIAPAQESEIQ